ncbi:MAG: dihydropteroate synthase [Candidatus Hodarchaeota archaeon]
MLIKGKLGEIPVGDTESTRVMGIINLSPGSFYKGSVKTTLSEIRLQLEKIVKEGADFVDVGAISSAPVFIYNDKDKISKSTELKRLSFFFKIFHEIGIDIPISVDTQSAKIADYALSKGATIINDISGFKSDSRLPSVISDHDASAIIMSCHHKPGDVFSIPDIKIELKKSLDLGINAGIKKDRIIIDPGIGGWVPHRQVEDDYLIINNLRKFRELKQCILLGISRKSFIGKILNVPPDKRLWGSLAATSIAVLNGVHVVRTHDVRETKDACIIVDFIKKVSEKETS